MRLIFEWDIRKERSNIRKHGISFDEAKSIFGDSNVQTFKDELHLDSEERLISIGLSDTLRILLVVHTETERRSEETVVRLVSARKATQNEQKKYEEG